MPHRHSSCRQYSRGCWVIRSGSSTEALLACRRARAKHLPNTLKRHRIRFHTVDLCEIRARTSEGPGKGTNRGLARGSIAGHQAILQPLAWDVCLLPPGVNRHQNARVAAPQAASWRRGSSGTSAVRRPARCASPAPPWARSDTIPTAQLSHEGGRGLWPRCRHLGVLPPSSPESRSARPANRTRLCR